MSTKLLVRKLYETQIIQSKVLFNFSVEKKHVKHVWPLMWFSFSSVALCEVEFDTPVLRQPGKGQWQLYFLYRPKILNMYDIVCATVRCMVNREWAVGTLVCDFIMFTVSFDSNEPRQIFFLCQRHQQQQQLFPSVPQHKTRPQRRLWTLGHSGGSNQLH